MPDVSHPFRCPLCAAGWALRPDLLPAPQPVRRRRLGVAPGRLRLGHHLHQQGRGSGGCRTKRRERRVDAGRSRPGSRPLPAPVSPHCPPPPSTFLPGPPTPALVHAWCMTERAGSPCACTLTSVVPHARVCGPCSTTAMQSSASRTACAPTCASTARTFRTSRPPAARARVSGPRVLGCRQEVP